MADHAQNHHDHDNVLDDDLEHVHDYVHDHVYDHFHDHDLVKHVYFLDISLQSRTQCLPLPPPHLGQGPFSL